MRVQPRPLMESLAARPAWMRHGFALLCASTAFSLEYGLRPWLAPAPLLLLTAGVLVAARFGGRGPGWLAAGASTLLAQGFLTGAPASLVFAAVAGLAATLAGRRAREGLDAAVLRGIGDAVLATDSRGVVRFLNPAAARLLGWTEAEAVGLPVSRVLRLLREDTREPVLDPISQVLGGALWTEQPRLLSRRDGSELPIEENAAPIHAASGAALGAVLVLRDASARRQLEQERTGLLAREHAALREAQAHRERLESLIRQAPVAIAVFRGQEHVCEMLNSYARELFDPDGTLAGRPLREVQPDMDPALLGLLDDVYRSGEPFSGREVPMALKPPPGGAALGGVQGRYFDMSWQPWRDADGTLQGVVAVAVEVTGLVSARRAAEALAQELREALHIRDEFLSIASHELKTPITSTQLQLQLLLRTVPADTAPATASAVRQRVETALRQVGRLHQLVTTLLDVSRIRAGRLQLQQEPLDLIALTQELVARAQEDAANARCPLHIDAEAGPLVGSWDRIRLEQVITNLLSNAFKYGAEKPVEVRVTREGSFARLSVTDHGIGIAPEDHERIFQRFERAVSERHYGGFGLGLWIVRQIVESLHGDIHVESQPGTGATFVVRLPLEILSSAVA